MTNATKRGYAAVGLDDPKDPINVGSVSRACGAYGTALMAIRGMRYKSVCSDTMKAHRHMPVLHYKNLHDAVPFDCVPVAVDIIEGATPLQEYAHPERAFYIFGPEDGTLGKRVTSWCRDIIFIPTIQCMNLAATVNVVLYDRLAKQLRKTS